MSQKGMSLIQVVIAIGLSGVLAVGLMRITENSQKSQNTVMQNFESLQVSRTSTEYLCNL